MTVVIDNASVSYGGVTHSCLGETDFSCDSV